MSKNSRGGGKYGGRHTTLIDAAREVCDAVVKIASVKSISPGFISAGLKAQSRGMRVKVIKSRNSVLLRVRGSTTLQEIRIFSDDIGECISSISSRLDELKIQTEIVH